MDKDFSHFVALTKGTTKVSRKEHVISREYFIVRNRRNQPVGHRISKETILKCTQSPNKLFSLSGADKRLIKQHVNMCIACDEICRIKKMPVKDKKMEFTVFGERQTISEIQFQGQDRNNRIHNLSYDWIEINFKERIPPFYKQLLQLKPEQKYIEVPVGSRSKLTSTYPLKSSKTMQKLRFVQRRDSSCLYCSIASSLYYISSQKAAFKLMAVYDNKNSIDDEYIPHINDIIFTLHNRFRERDERKLRVDVKKMKQINVMELLDKNDDEICWCILKNNHAIAMVNDYIFDSGFEKTLPRNERGLRISSETEENEEIHSCIIKGYFIKDASKSK